MAIDELRFDLIYVARFLRFIHRRHPGIIFHMIFNDACEDQTPPISPSCDVSVSGMCFRPEVVR